MARHPVLAVVVAVVAVHLGLAGTACSASGPDPLNFTKKTTTTAGAAGAAAPSKPLVPDGPSTTAVSLDAHRPHVPMTHPSPLGMNLSSIRDYSTEQPFVDVFKQSRDWISTREGEWDDKRPIARNARGWVTSLLPGQSARSLVIWGDVPYPKGTYKVRWKGKGTINFWPQADNVSSTGEGSYDLAADPKKGGIAVTITSTDPADPIRDIRVILPGADDKTVWNPAFLQVIKPFSVLRVMDWLETNNSTLKAAADRPAVDNATYAIHGVPAEVIANLANTTGADLWVNVGHQWSDELVDAFATALRDSIDPKRRIYVEFSNEVWNGMFTQARAMSDQGAAAKLSDDTFQAGLMMHAQRSVAVHKRFDAVFGPRQNQIVRVLGAWAANGWSTGIMLKHLDKLDAEVDAVAIAPYFGNDLGTPAKRGQVQGMGQAELMAALDGAVDEAVAWTREQVEIAAKHKVAVIAYEGGQHLVGVGPVMEDNHINTLFDRANTHPKMKDLYLRYLNGWKHAGGSLFVHFTTVAPPGKFGRWGAMERLDQPRAEAPKYDALLTFIEGTPRWY